MAAPQAAAAPLGGGSLIQRYSDVLNAVAKPARIGLFRRELGGVRGFDVGAGAAKTLTVIGAFHSPTILPCGCAGTGNPPGGTAAMLFLPCTIAGKAAERLRFLCLLLLACLKHRPVRPCREHRCFR